MPPTPQVIVSGAFDDVRSRDLRFLQEAAKLGEVTVLVWTDAAIERIQGKLPKFPSKERDYFLNGLRYVSRVVQIADPEEPAALLAMSDVHPNIWVDLESPANSPRDRFCGMNRIEYRVLSEKELNGFPLPAETPPVPGRKKIFATGCYDWLHSGHIRFAEEASAYGELCICVGSDANVSLLKGKGHPLFPEDERRYLVSAIKYVKQTLISSGAGWLDADPEIRRIKPDIYVVNEDGDKGGKREYCQNLGIEYLVLKRTPALGLPRRNSTDLRGF